MRRLGYTEFGDTSVLSWAETPTPMPSHGEVLVRTRAASLNPTDSKVRSGELKALALLRRKPYGMGMDIAGVVEAIGNGVTAVRIGDRVAGMTASGDGFADAAVVKADRLAAIPDGVDFAHAAAMTMSAATAVGIVEGIHPARGSRVFVSGGSGGIGQYLIRLLILAGSTVAASGSAPSLGTIRALGAEPHDYRALDPAALAGRFDVVIDLSGAVRLADASPWLRRGGRFFPIVPDARDVLDAARTVVPGIARHRSRVLAVTSNAERIRRAFIFASAGSLPVRLGAEYPLSDAIAVLARVEAGNEAAIGKIVLTTDGDAAL
ncbi:NADP-dependent oxidoreductase [Microbacteriaceae bacterium VKM Ac-2855]|nr:NADP-dependent oxidoreductase [Microbacteriaceae bacterium VKM Ac-2855]